MSDPIDWSLTTFEGNRRRQHREFLALPFREKVARLEQMADVAAYFADRRAMRLAAAAPGIPPAAAPGTVDQARPDHT